MFGLCLRPANKDISEYKQVNYSITLGSLIICQLFFAESNQEKDQQQLSSKEKNLKFDK